MTTYDFQAFCVICLMAVAAMLFIWYRWSWWLLMLGDITVMGLIVLSVVSLIVAVGFMLGWLYYGLAMKQAQVEAERAKADKERAKADHERAKAISVSQYVVPIKPGHSLYTNQSLMALQAPNLPGEVMPLLPVLDDFVLPLDRWWAMANKLHTMIVGQTDSGKSYTAKAMLRHRLANGGKAVIIDPHYEAGDWFGLPVVGAKRNFNQIDETFLAVLSEVNKRFELRANQAGVQFDEVTVVIDEVPAVNANCKHWDKFVSTMSSEARKVNYKLLVLSQSRLVEAFGLKGKSDMRENFSELLLGDFAIKAVKSDKVLAGLLGGLGRGGVLDCVGLHVVDLGGINRFLELELPKNCIQELVFRGVGGNTASKKDTDNLPENWEQIADLLRSGLSANQIYAKLGGNRNDVMGVIRSVKTYLEHQQSGQLNGYGVLSL